MPFGGGSSGSSSGAGTELDYAQVTVGLTVTATTDATAQAFVTGNAVSYDGSTIVLITFWCESGTITAGQAVVCNLYDGSTDLGEICNLQSITATSPTGNTAAPLVGMRRLTPSAAAHTYSVRGWKTGGTATLSAGTGGTATILPAFLRITRA